MALSVQSDVKVFERESIGRPWSPTAAAIEEEIYGLERQEYARPDSCVDTGSVFSLGDFQLKPQSGRIEGIGFSLNNPWLPTNALKLLERLKRGPIIERELVKLMDIVAERAAVHFQLNEGEFVAMTFSGRIVEVSDTRVGLLKKIHGQKYREQIFVWRAGSNVFSGRV
jgi:hypothetical protein